MSSFIAKFTLNSFYVLDDLNDVRYIFTYSKINRSLRIETNGFVNEFDIIITNLEAFEIWDKLVSMMLDKETDNAIIIYLYNVVTF